MVFFRACFGNTLHMLPHSTFQCQRLTLKELLKLPATCDNSYSPITPSTVSFVQKFWSMLLE